MRRIESLIPGAAAHDEFGQHCAKLLRRADELGSLDAAVQEELHNPTWADADWCRMITARAAGQVPMFQDDDAVMYRCNRCRDTGFITSDHTSHSGQTVRMARRCEPCAYMRWLKAEYELRQEREGTRRKSRLREGL